jgi:hypothetical protein
MRKDKKERKLFFSCTLKEYSRRGRRKMHFNWPEKSQHPCWKPSWQLAGQWGLHPRATRKWILRPTNELGRGAWIRTRCWLQSCWGRTQPCCTHLPTYSPVSWKVEAVWSCYVGDSSLCSDRQVTHILTYWTYLQWADVQVWQSSFWASPHFLLLLPPPNTSIPLHAPLPQISHSPRHVILVWFTQGDLKTSSS